MHVPGLRSKPSFLILDGHPSSAHGLAAALREEGVESVDVATAVQGRLPRQPDAIVVDFATLHSGPSVIRALAEAFPGTRIAVFTECEDGNSVAEAVNSGAQAYLSKRAPLIIVISALRLMLAGEFVIGPYVLGSLVSVPQPQVPLLTDSERDLLRLLAEGADNAEMASRLAMSEATIKRRLHEVEKKLQARNRIQAATRAMKLGLV